MPEPAPRASPAHTSIDAAAHAVFRHNFRRPPLVGMGAGRAGKARKWPARLAPLAAKRAPRKSSKDRLRIASGFAQGSRRTRATAKRWSGARRKCGKEKGKAWQTARQRIPEEQRILPRERTPD